MQNHLQDSDLIAILREVKTIALIGASNNPERPSYQVMAFLLSQGYKVAPVNPKLAGNTILDQHVYASLTDIPYSIDIVDVFRKAETVQQIARESTMINAKVLWLQLGIINETAAAEAKRAGIKVVMDRCLKIEIQRLGLVRQP